MASILEDLWYGKIAPCETCGVEDAEIEELMKCMGEYENTLRCVLQDSHKELFMRYARWSDMYARVISEKAFQEGFRLAAKLVSEIALK